MRVHGIALVTFGVWMLLDVSGIAPEANTHDWWWFVGFYAMVAVGSGLIVSSLPRGNDASH